MNTPFHAVWPALGLATALAASAAQTQPASQPTPAAGKPAAAAPAKSHQRCFRPQDINGWRPGGDDRTVYVNVGASRVFRMKLFAPCPDVNWAERVGIEARGSPWICSGLDATLIAPSSIGPHRCPVTDITELTPAEAKALPKRRRP